MPYRSLYILIFCTINALQIMTVTARWMSRSKSQKTLETICNYLYSGEKNLGSQFLLSCYSMQSSIVFTRTCTLRLCHLLLSLLPEWNWYLFESEKEKIQTGVWIQIFGFGFKCTENIVKKTTDFHTVSCSTFNCDLQSVMCVSIWSWLLIGEHDTTRVCSRLIFFKLWK